MMRRVALLLVFWPVAALAAAAPAITPLSGTLRGAPGEALTASFSVKGVEKMKLHFFNPGSGNLPVASVALPLDVILADDLPLNFAMAITAPKQAGKYSGNVQLFYGGKEPLLLPLTIEVVAAKTPVSVTPVNQVVLLVDSNCEWVQRLLNCASPKAVPLGGLRNEKHGNVNITGTELAVFGAHSRALPEPTIGKGTSAKPWIPITASFNGSRLETDRYTGTLFINVEGVEAAVALPLDISVRDAPWWPLAMIAFGISLGLLVHFMDTKGAKQIDIMRRADRVTLGLEAEDVDILVPMIREVRIGAYVLDLERAGAAMKEVEHRAELLTTLRKLQREVEGLGDYPEIVERIKYARGLIRREHDPTDEIKAIEKDVAAIGKPTVTAMAADASEIVRQGPAVERQAPLWQRLRATFLRYFVAPVLQLSLLFVLVVIGFYTLYVDKPTFGAGGFADYLSLVLWGLGSNIATATFGGLSALFKR